MLIVDMQNDFCNPSGTLFVEGADSDVKRLGEFIMRNSGRINHIIMTLDNHHVVDISHPVFWEDATGNPPPVFTTLTTSDVLNHVWRPRFERKKAIRYIQDLENQGEFPHVIWPEHCIIGSAGAAVVEGIMEPVKSWARKGNFFEVIVKGTNPLTEHFGALMANVPIEGSTETHMNARLVYELKHFSNILIAGEAKSHCVATTLKQMMAIEGLAQKLIVLEDCTSNVPGFETLALPIFEKALNYGVRFVNSKDWIH